MEGRERRGGEGSEEPSTSGSLVAGGGQSGWGPSVGFAGLAPRLLPCGVLSQVTGDHAARGLGRLCTVGDRVVRGCSRPPRLPRWPPGRSTHCSGDSNTVAMNGRVDFPKKKLAHQ